MAAAEVAVVILPPPPREPVVGLPADAAAAKALMYLYLATLWVGCAGSVAVSVARQVWGAGSPVVCALLKVPTGALLFAALLIVVFVLLLLRSRRATGFRLGTDPKEIESRKVFGASLWEKLLYIGGLTCFPLILLLVVGYLVLIGLFPTEGSQKRSNGSFFVDLVLFIFMTACCIFILPDLALDLWMIN